MRTPLLAFLLPLLVAGFWDDSEDVIPKNIVENYIKSNANWSVDPCDDFYAHVCPSTSKGRFLFNLVTMRQDIIQDFKNKNPDLNYFEDQDATKNNGEVLLELFKSGELRDLCIYPKYEAVLTSLARQSNVITDDSKFDEFHQMTCEEKVEHLKENDLVAKSIYTTARYNLLMAYDSYIANKAIDDSDVKIRVLFEKLRNGVLKAIRKTPWAKNNHSVKLFLEAIQNIVFTTYADMRNATEAALSQYITSNSDCQERLHDFMDSHQITAICDAIATGRAQRILSAPNEKIHKDDFGDIITDYLRAFSSQDNRVYIGNDFMLLMNTDLPSDLYGSIGYSLAHEIMHTIVFDERDAKNPLRLFWTKNAGCVQEQFSKTCETFPTMPCDSPETSFEEDAADLAAYRIVFDLYQKAYRRKEVVPNYESLNKKQLFFYGTAAVFCDPRGMIPTLSRSQHNNGYQRLNSLMSQMEAFSDAFKCKPTDKMIKNKARHCELYGRSAPMTRKNNDNGF